MKSLSMKTCALLLALLSLSARAADNEVVNWTAGVAYEYDSSGNVKKIGNDTFVYDSAGRVIRAGVNGVTRTYEYDAFANRTRCTHAPGTGDAGDCQNGYTIDTAGNRNRLRQAVYDAHGNVTALFGRQYAFDATDVMTREQAGTAAREFIYTASGDRIATHTTDTGRWNWTLRDSAGRVVREYTSSGSSSWKWVKDYVWRGDLLLASRQMEGAGTSTYHYHLDHLGTPRRITDAFDNLAGFHDYYAFGPETGDGKDEPSTTALKYTGHERDEWLGNSVAALDYMHARYYSPSSARFMSVDPIPGDAHQTQSWNLYAYVQNNPIRATDPEGLTLYMMTADAAKDLCEFVGPDCAKFITIEQDGKVKITASEADLKANEGLNLINDMVKSSNDYGAWVGTSLPTGTNGFSYKLGDKMKSAQVVNLSTNFRTDVSKHVTQHLPANGLDGAVGLFSGYASIAASDGQGGKPVSRAMTFFHELAENYHRTEKLKQYKESHQEAITRENILRSQRTALNQFSHGSGPNKTTLKP